jgi:hypothetical protein
MKFSTLALASFAAATQASPLTTRQDTTTCPVVTSGDYIWRITNLSIRKLHSPTISTLTFDILATNGGTLNFTCAPYDKSTNAPVTTEIKDSTLYSCGENSFIDFAWQADRDGLLLKQSVSDNVKLVGTATLPSYCHAGGTGPDDFACVGVSDAYVTLVQEV